MDSLKEILKHFVECTYTELKGLRKLDGEKLAKFVEIFNVDEDCDIFYNKYNMVFIDPESHEQMEPYLKIKNKILSLDFPEYNIHVWAYKYYNDNLFDSYLDDSK